MAAAAAAVAVAAAGVKVKAVNDLMLVILSLACGV